MGLGVGVRLSDLGFCIELVSLSFCVVSVEERRGWKCSSINLLAGEMVFILFWARKEGGSSSIAILKVCMDAPAGVSPVRFMSAVEERRWGRGI